VFKKTNKVLKCMKVLKLFLEQPSQEFNVREISRLLKISPATASAKLKKLEEQGILKKRKTRQLHLYKANLENDLYKDLKTFYNIRKLKESGLINALNKFYLKPTIILFGSTVYGLDDQTSDVDLLIITEKTKNFPHAKEYEKKLNRPLQLLVVKNIRELKNKHLINNVLNGVIIQGGIKWI